MLAAADLITRADVSFGPRIEKLRQLFGRNPAVTQLVSRITSGTDNPSASRLAAAAVMLFAGPEMHLLVPYGPAGHVPRVSYYRVVAGEPGALALLRGKIVLVGGSDLRNQAEMDTFHTVFGRPDNVELSGVEIGATACLNLLYGDAAHPASQIATILLAGGSAVAAVFTGMMLPSILGLGTIFAIGGAASAMSVAVLEARHMALPLGSVLLVSLPLGLLAGRLSRHDFARRQLDQVVDILARRRVRHLRPAKRARASHAARGALGCLPRDGHGRLCPADRKHALAQAGFSQSPRYISRDPARRCGAARRHGARICWRRQHVHVGGGRAEPSDPRPRGPRGDGACEGA